VFTGKERDAESGLDYFGARYYSSSIGRWMSPDWADKPEAVPYSSLDNPQSLNLYGYVLNNPLTCMSKEEMTWEAAYSLLSKAEDGTSADSICTAITRLGKPFDAMQVRRAAPLVSTYLHHGSFLARYQAIWFLGCWGKLHEYLPQIIESVQSDAEMDNRAFAARCAGQILKSHHDANAVRTLLRIASSEEEEPDLRLAAYSALLYAFYGTDARSRAVEFEPAGDKTLADFDPSWLTSVKEWADGLGAIAK
jgi:RHS repeat-associated protein